MSGAVVRRLQLDGRPVRVLEQGSGPPVFLVHGLGLGAGLWTPHLERLAAGGYRAIAPDLPGFGRSGGPALGQSVPEAAAWLGRLADALDVRRAAWLGHSLGTQQVVHLATRDPERVAAAVLAAPTGRVGRPGLRQLGGLLTTAFRERPRLVASVVRRYSLAPVTTVGTWLRGLAHDTALEATLIRCPVLLVLGARDPLVPESFARRLERLIPDARTTRIEGAAHAVALDPVAPFVETVLRFLARRYSRESTDRWKSSGMASKFHGPSGP